MPERSVHSFLAPGEIAFFPELQQRRSPSSSPAIGSPPFPMASLESSPLPGLQEFQVQSPVLWTPAPPEVPEEIPSIASPKLNMQNCEIPEAVDAQRGKQLCHRFFDTPRPPGLRDSALVAASVSQTSIPDPSKWSKQQPVGDDSPGVDKPVVGGNKLKERCPGARGGQGGRVAPLCLAGGEQRAAQLAELQDDWERLCRHEAGSLSALLLSLKSKYGLGTPSECSVGQDAAHALRQSLRPQSNDDTSDSTFQSEADHLGTCAISQRGDESFASL
eukprot:CAMPEP_0177583492 /NCGR_PEP_ID=MMETSP0419_2-20121207/3352_1 /TAXON_ID=582737 /ORGANISM="Tetraselmis sp., Strain GSL018" /LENGTH=274 /DNA_ID=CAMNT_0019072889 /DNA_START=270 /DNA_END=1091 /DNA_ORIENTATION=+